MSNPRGLPNELMLHIFSLLSKERGALFNLLFLHPVYRSSLECILYRNMTDWIHLESHIGFLATVKGNDRLASYVHRFGIMETSLDHFNEFDNEEESRPLFWDHVLTAVENMINLKGFIVGLYNYRDFPASKLLSALEPKRLESFKWNVPSMTGVLPFLATQPRLVDLSITIPVQPGFDLKTDLSAKLPNLRRLSGNWGALQAVIPGNDSLRRLSWSITPVETYTSADLPSFLKSMRCNLTSLAIYDSHRPLKYLILYTLPTAFPHLVCLQIPAQLAYIQEARRISFPSLRYLIIEGAFTQKAVDPTDIGLIFSASASLRAIYSGPLGGATDMYTFMQSKRKRDALDWEHIYCCWERENATNNGALNGEGAAGLVMEFSSLDSSIYHDLPDMLMGTGRQ